MRSLRRAPGCKLADRLYAVALVLCVVYVAHLIVRVVLGLG